MEYNLEAKRKIRVGFIGAGGHSYRNLYPCFHYAPVDLVAIADHHAEKAAGYARLFGAERWYTDHQNMLTKERLDAVFISVGFDAEGRPRYPQLVADAVRAGCHVWIEKPPAMTSGEVADMQRVSAQAGKFVAVGYKKMFVPTYQKVKETISDSSFGRAGSFAMRYRLILPPAATRDQAKAWAGFMDICHPCSALHYLFGRATSLVFQRTATGDAVALLGYAQGTTVGTLHLTGRQADSGPLERLEVVGEGAHIVVENCTRLIYYRKGGSRGVGGYGRTTSFFGSDEMAPITWEPEFSLGQLYNKAIFLQGFVQEIDYFARCILDQHPPAIGSLDDAWHLTRLFEAFRYGEEGKLIELAALSSTDV